MTPTLCHFLRSLYCRALAMSGLRHSLFAHTTFTYSSVEPTCILYSLPPYKKPNPLLIASDCLSIMSDLNSSTLEANILLFFLTLIVAWFCVIIYYIPVQLYLDQKAIITEQRLEDPNLISKLY